MAVDSMSMAGSVNGTSSKWSTLPGFRESWRGLLAIIVIEVLIFTFIFNYMLSMLVFFTCNLCREHHALLVSYLKFIL